MQVTKRFLVGEDDGLILSDDLPPYILPAWRQLPQLLQLTHPLHTENIQKKVFILNYM